MILSTEISFILPALSSCGEISLRDFRRHRVGSFFVYGGKFLMGENNEAVNLKVVLSAATKLNKSFWDKIKELTDDNEFGADETLMMITVVYAKITAALLDMAKDTESIHTFSNLLSTKDFIIRNINNLNSSTLKKIEEINKILPKDK